MPAPSCHPTRKHYAKGLCSSCYSSPWIIAHMKKRKKYIGVLKQYIGCQDCGYNDKPEALDFDHKPGTKSFNIGANEGRSWVNLLTEMAKCEVVCANCHRIRTYNRLQV